MTPYQELSRQELAKIYEDLLAQYEQIKGKKLHLDMSRGKPSPEQLDISVGLLTAVSENEDCLTPEGIDVRNYGVLEGLPEMRAIFGKILGAAPENVIVGGNSSLNLMYDIIARIWCFGIAGEKPWGLQEKIKFLCPVPGYDRHFAITETFGVEMIQIPMTSTGPDMDLVEQYVENDPQVKGIWCIPMYSNPGGVTYSDDTVRRFAAMKPAAKDFRIFWDNAYCMHHLCDDHDELLNLLDECKRCGCEDKVFMFTSTSKISFSGAGVSAFAGSKANVEWVKKYLTVQTIGYDKLNQQRHVKYFKNYENIVEHMKKHRALIAPKFELVLERLNREIKPLALATWHEPKGGYFISVDTLPGCAKRTVQLCKEAGVTLTGAGASFPLKHDPLDRNIRLAPTYPSLEELADAIDIFCICLRVAAVEMLMNA